MRGYFAIGAERISKAGNVGTLVRSAHAFGASFAFIIEAGIDMKEMRLVDTSDAAGHMPLYTYKDAAELQLPRGCRIVGVELTDEAVELPSFRHPLRAAYVLGPERGSLSPEMVARCDHVVRIPMKFCVNVGIAGAIVMYDRMISLGRFAERPVRAGGPTEPPPTHVYGKPVIRSAAALPHLRRTRKGS
ncbi:MAG TPA: RNA methyltransferase [Azospirillaceae bacterium]|nr:RNA methyltransferase [Azospirillaceae bacterium]